MLRSLDSAMGCVASGLWLHEQRHRTALNTGPLLATNPGRIRPNQTAVTRSSDTHSGFRARILRED